MKRKLCCHLKDKGIKFEVIIDEYFTNHVDIELLKNENIIIDSSMIIKEESDNLFYKNIIIEPIKWDDEIISFEETMHEGLEV